MNLTTVVLTRNEAQNLNSCLKSLNNLADEIIIIDDNSIDQTKQIAHRFQAKVYQHPLDQNFARQRNFGLEKATQEWVLFLDADERIGKKLKEEIKIKISDKTSPYSGFYLKRRDFFLGQNLRFGETANVKLLRLARRTAGHWHRPVHEIWQIQGKIGELQYPLVHYAHPNLTHFLEKINTYTDIETQFRHQAMPESNQLKRLSLLCELFLFPPLKFIHNYLFKLGFLDGFPGFIMAYFMSFHSLILRIKLLSI